VQFKFDAWEQYLKMMPNLEDKDIKFCFDEWSSRNRAVGGGTPPPSHPILNTLTIALTFHEFFRHSDMVGLAVETGGMGMTVPATMAEKALPEAPGRITVPAASISVYEFPVK